MIKDENELDKNATKKEKTLAVLCTLDIQLILVNDVDNVAWDVMI